MNAVLLILSASLVLQLVAAWLAIRLIRTTGSSPAWLFIAAALLLMTGRRAISLQALVDGSHSGHLSTELVALAISVAMLVGVASIGPVFRRLDENRAALARARAELRGVIDHAPDGIALVRDGICVYANRVLVATLGLGTTSELRGKRLSDLAVPEDRARLVASLRGDVITTPLEVRFGGNGTGSVYLEIALGPEVVFDGALARVVAFRDHTERRRLEQQLRESQKMDAVGRLAGGVAHDFNNLLTVIVASTHLARAALPAGSPAAEDLDASLEAAERAAGLTRQLLAFSRHQVAQRRTFDLNDLVGSTVAMLSRVLGAHVVPDVRLAPGPLRVHADPSQLEQVVVNLMLNARDAMPSGGTLSVRTEVLDLDPEAFALPLDASRGPYAVLGVSDTGHGMTADVRARIFEPFFTTKEPGKGTGLGLATCFAVVRGLGGHIAVRSEPGQGSTFLVHLPVAARSTDEASPVQRDAPAATTHGAERILLVDDEAPLRDVAARVLRSRGYRVDVAATGAEALALIAAQGPPDLLLTDVVMPGMNGRELAVRVAAQHPEVSVLLVSGYVDGGGTHDGNGAPFHRLEKPYTPDQLCRHVRAVLDRQPVPDAAPRR